MKVEELIEKLQEMDPAAKVVFEGSREDACFQVRDVIGDDSGSFVMLLAGDELPVTIED